MTRHVRKVIGPALAALFLAGCGKQNEPPPPQPVEVGVVEARAESVPLTRELVGRLSATRSADVRARVSGVLLRRLYKEGTIVTAGQPLFQIDPAPLRAALNGAQASLAQAEAAATNAAVTAKRNRELATNGLVSRAAVDDAEAAERSTAAQVLQAKANVDVARINLSYATVSSPIAGRAGQQRVTEGALVGQGEATLLTTVEQVDPIYVNFDQPAAEVEQLRRQQTEGSVTLADRNATRVEVFLQDGTPYSRPGTLDFLDFSVNPTTGALAFRAVVPNPDRQLLPGMYVNLRLALGQLNRAYLVPQAALQRDTTGPFVKVVNAEGKVEQKRVSSESARGSNWVVTSGLADGDQLIVTNFAKARPGMPANAVPTGSAGQAAPVTPIVQPSGAASSGAPPSGARPSGTSSSGASSSIGASSGAPPPAQTGAPPPSKP